MMIKSTKIQNPLVMDVHCTSMNMHISKGRVKMIVFYR